jgi:hypothetical protein
MTWALHGGEWPTLNQDRFNLDEGTRYLCEWGCVVPRVGARWWRGNLSPRRESSPKTWCDKSPRSLVTIPTPLLTWRVLETSQSQEMGLLIKDMQWGLNTSFSSGVLKKNDGNGKTIHLGTTDRGFNVYHTRDTDVLRKPTDLRMWSRKVKDRCQWDWQPPPLPPTLGDS